MAERTCTCLGTCRGADGLAPGWVCALQPRAACSLCPQCGLGVSVDEDGCCASCGCESVGEGVDQVVAELRTLRARVAELERAARESDDALREYHEATAERMAEMERDARLGAVVREAVGDDVHLFEAYAVPVRREHADTGMERAPVYDRVLVAIADALRAEEGGERG